MSAAAARRRGRQCEVVDVDGVPIKVQTNGPLTDEGREALVKVLRAARVKAEDEADLQLRLEHLRDRGDRG